MLSARLVSLFSENYGRSPTIVTRAPGRIEFIGNHTDYNGGAVLGAAIDRSVWVAVAPREDGVRRFLSEGQGGVIIEQTGDPVRAEGATSWINYPQGVLAGMTARGLKLPGGFDYAVLSDLPTGAGLSSSAAIELASALAFLALTGEELSRVELVKLGRWAENEFVGVPCGILDQGVSGFGRADHLVHIDCRGPEFATVPMPAGTHFWVFNTHVGHALVDGLYAARHRECMTAAQVLDVAWLTEADSAQLEAAKSQLDDTVYRRARHVIEEHGRVQAAQAALAAGDSAAVGALLTASHRSSQHLFGNSTEQLDWLVDTLTAERGVFGARLTGGGFGGAVMAWTDATFDEAAAQRVGAAYGERWGQPSVPLHLRTGDGAQRME